MQRNAESFGVPDGSQQTVAERRARSDPRLGLPPGPGLPASDVAAHQTARIQAALIEVVAQGGYANLKIRDLVKAARVSTRAFYERYAGKEDCFLQTYELLSRRATRRIIAAQAGESEWRHRLRLVLEEFAQEAAREPVTARFLLVDAYAAGPVAMERAWRTERHLEGMLAESFARPPAGTLVPPLMVEAMVAGTLYVIRNRLSVGRVAEVDALGDELTRWALSYASASARGLAELDGNSVWRNTMLDPLPETALGAGGAWPPTPDRALILSTVAKLAATEGYESLSVPRIRAAAGVTRRAFDTHFDSVDACYVAAFETRATEAFAQVARAQTAARTWEGGIYRAMAALCECIAGDAFLAGVCLVDEFSSGSEESRARKHQIDAIAEQLSESVPSEVRPSALMVEATAGAVWGVFLRHMVRDWAKQRHIAASLAFLVLAPLVGGPDAVAAIRAEQSA